MRLLLTKRRGETLVEVIVAFGILSIVMMGVASVTAEVLSLSVNSRNRTESVMIAQKNLAIAKNILETSCAVTTFTDNIVYKQGYLLVTDATPVLGSDSTIYQGAIKRGAIVYLYPLKNSESAYGLTNDNNFRKLVSKVTWYEKGQQKSYIISEIVRR